MRDLNVTSLPGSPFRMRGSRVIQLAMVVVSLEIALADSLWAQGPKPRPPVPDQPQPKKNAPPVAKGGAPELKIDSVTLPEGYAPPADRDPLMELDLPIALPDEINRLRRDVPKYQTVLRTAKFTDNDKQLIKSGIRFRLAEMTLKEKRPILSKLHDDLLREINSAASAPDNPKNIKEFRQIVLQELLNQAAPLLETQNFYVRLHIAILLGQLDLTEDNKYTKQEAFVPAYAPLVKLITDPSQPEAIKIPATNGLVRILRLGNPNVVDRTKIAQAIVSELKNKKADPWYQMRLAGALSSVDVDLDQQRQPFIVDMLKQILADGGRTWQVRSEAAYSLGRVPLPAACSPPTVLTSIGDYVLKLAKAAQQQPPKGSDDPKWRSEFIKVYLAFQQYDKDDLMADKRNKAGLLNNPVLQAKPLYSLIVPMTAAIIHGQRLTVQQVQSLESSLDPSGAAAPPAGGNFINAPQNDGKPVPPPSVQNKSESGSNAQTIRAETKTASGN